MNNIMFLKNVLNNNDNLIKSIIHTGKEDFISNEKLITVSLGIFLEIKEILNSIDSDIFVLSKSFYDIIYPIKEYCNNLFTHYKLPNAYKLYDALCIDLQNLKTFLNTLEA